MLDFGLVKPGAGARVFDADTPFQMIARHLRAEPVPPSRRTERPVPPALERLVLDCLAKEAEDRPQSAAELGRSLAAIDVEPWDQEQAMRWWKAQGAVPAAVLAKYSTCP